MKILSLSTVYPNPAEPGLGLFVRSRLMEIARRDRLKVIAPLPRVDYSNPYGKYWQRRQFSMSRQDGPIEVLHPWWIFPPLGTPLNILCLLVRLYPLMRKLRRQFDFDLIDAHFGYPEGVVSALLALLFDTPFLITLRGSEPVFARHRWRDLVMRWAFRRADRLITVSEQLRQFAIDQGAPAEKVVVIPNGIDRDVFYPRDRVAARKKFGIPPERRVIVSAGELVEAKGHQHVAEALRAVVTQGVDAELRIVGGTARGGPKYETALRAYANSLNLGDRIKFVGWIDRENLANLLSAADLFCLASYTEGWPNVIQESLACGTPIVATRVGAVPQMIPSADYGAIVSAKDQLALQDALQTALTTDWDRNKIALWGRQRSWTEVAEAVCAVFERVLRESAARRARGNGARVRPDGI